MRNGNEQRPAVPVATEKSPDTKRKRLRGAVEPAQINIEQPVRNRNRLLSPPSPPLLMLPVTSWAESLRSLHRCHPQPLAAC
jgi:hypothetical protein